MSVRSRLAGWSRPPAAPLKTALLALVFVRFHGSWIGAAVVLLMAFLLFGVDRALGRWTMRLLGASK